MLGEVAVKPLFGYIGHVANILDVAKLAGVSPTTAKRAIREPHLLAAETLERVQRAIETLHYEPDQLASALRSGHNKTIGLIIGSIVEPFFATLTRTIGDAIRARGYTLIIADNEYRSELELEHLRHFHGNRVSGLILRSGYGKTNLEYLKRVWKRGTAIVEIDHFYPHSPFSHVMLENREAVYQGVNYLASLGHQCIAAFGTYDEMVLPDERTQAFPEAMRANGLGVAESYRHIIRPTQEDAYRTAHLLMDLAQPPTALFALTGNMAIGAYRALRERGLRIPEDVSLLAFDNYPWTELVDPGIDVIEQPVEAMGLAAVEILFEAINGKAPGTVRRRFPGRLIARGSCAPPA